MFQAGMCRRKRIFECERHKKKMMYREKKHQEGEKCQEKSGRKMEIEYRRKRDEEREKNEEKKKKEKEKE